MFKALLPLILLALFARCTPAGNDGQNNHAQDPTAPAEADDPLENEIARISAEIKNNPSEPGNYISRARAYAEQGKLQLAITDAKQAIAIDSSIARWHFDLGNYQERLPYVKGALESYGKATRLNQNYKEAFLRRGILFFLTKDRPNSFRNLNEALRIDPQLAEAYYYKGYNYREMGDGKKALENFKKAAEFRPDHADTYLNLGLLAQDMNDAKARDYFNTAVRLDPSSLKSRYSRGLYLQSIDSSRAAAADFAEIISIDEDYERAEFALGYNLYRLGEYEQARQAFQQSNRTYPQDALGQYSLGLALLKLGIKDEAREAFEAALTIDPDFSDAAAELNALRGR